MVLSIKFCIAAFSFCCAVAFSRADYYEDQYQSTWKTFLMRHTIDPDVNVTYRNWTTQNWLRLLDQRDVLIREDCEKCDSLFKNDMNTLFVARKNEIIEAFSPNKDDLKDPETAWSSKAFQTYTILNGSVFHCGLQYFYAQVDEQGLPTDLLSLSDSRDRLNSNNLYSRINCYNIDESNVGSATASDELDGEDWNASEDISEDDAEDDIPEEGFSEDISDYYLDEDVPENDFEKESLDDDFPEETSEIEFSEDLEPDAEENEFDETRVRRQLQLLQRQKYYRKNLGRLPWYHKTIKPYPRYVRSVDATYEYANDFSENSDDEALENAEQVTVEEISDLYSPESAEPEAGEDVIGIPRNENILERPRKYRKFPNIICNKTKPARILQNELTEENSERDVEESITDDIAGDNPDVYENDEIKDFGDIEDDAVDTRVKRQLQLRETRTKLYNKFPIRQHPRLHQLPKAEQSQSDIIDDEDDSVRVRRQIRIPPNKLTFPKSSEFNKYPFPNGFRNPVLINKFVEGNSEDDYTDEVSDDEYADQISGNDFVDEIDEENIAEDNSYQEPSEDAEIDVDEYEGDTTRTKRQIRIPRPRQTFQYPRYIKTIYYPPNPHNPRQYIRKIRSADVIKPAQAFPCTPPFAPCNPRDRNCKPVGPCRPPPYLPQTPRFPTIRF
ncbi:unnamed protein product [Allacma fusca]|uniref:Uncharacterized protein n=1 Tax=Allacma fusca TaxID=39272 RepID=A0A8J2K9A4_9HEXA|nr:unnamed protein product [Allacma fusca]